MLPFATSTHAFLLWDATKCVEPGLFDSLLHCLKSTLHKAEFKALLTSIIKAFLYKKKKNPIYRNTQTVISLWFCLLNKRFSLSTVLKHCKEGHLVQLLTATDYQWCEENSLDIVVCGASSCSTNCSKQRATQKGKEKKNWNKRNRKEAHGSTRWASCTNKKAELLTAFQKPSLCNLNSRMRCGYVQKNHKANLALGWNV